MPIDQSKKRVKSIPVKVKTRKSGKKTAVIFIIVIVLILISLYLLLSRKPSSTIPGPSESETKTASQADMAEPGEVPQEQGYILEKAKLVLESINNQNIIKVDIKKATGESGEEIVFRYDWSVNGKPAGDGSNTLKGFKGGDKIAVKITPIDGEKVGQSKTLEQTVQNTPPQVVDDKQPKYDGKMFSYQVKGTDSDGDVLTYSLEEAPKGMMIDKQTGRINWQLGEDDYGEHTIKVKVADSKGASTMYTVKVDLPKPTEEKKTEESKK